MGRQLAIICALGLGLVTALGTASAVRAEVETEGHGHPAVSHGMSGAPMAQLRQQGGGISLNVGGLNNSGITGTALLRAVDADKFEVELHVNGAGAGPLPAHIHEGACADLNPVPQIPLRDVTNGASATELDGSLQQLAASPHAIFLHRSPQELPIFVGCADIVPASQLSTVPSAGEAGPWADVGAGLFGLGLVLAAAGYMLQRRMHNAAASTRG